MIEGEIIRPIVVALHIRAEQAINNFIQHSKNEWVSLGKRTPEQLDAENQIYLFVLKLFGVDFTFVSDVAGKIAEVSGTISGWEESDYYEVYEIIPESPITTMIRVLIASPEEGGQFVKKKDCKAQRCFWPNEVIHPHLRKIGYQNRLRASNFGHRLDKL